MPVLDEFGLIRLLTSGRGQGPTERVAVGIGDDAAVLNSRSGFQWVASCDTMVQESHFKPETMTYEAVGFKAMAANISDMAAMGAIPRFALVALVALSVPGDLAEDRLLELYNGLYDCAGRYGTAIVGGDTTSSPSGLTITVTVIGEVETGRALLRSGAQPGDAIFITGPLGLSAAGLHLMLSRGGSAYNTDGLPQGDMKLVEAHQRPSPQVEAGRILSSAGLGRSLNDISDGLASEAWELAEASCCRMVLDEALLPLDPELAAYAAAAGLDPLELMLYGGEDYQLIGTVASEHAGRTADAFANKELGFYRIGETAAPDAGSGGAGVFIRRLSGAVQPVGKKGYNHFRTTKE